MASASREDRVARAVACPRCGAAVGERCRNPHPHQVERGARDRREQPERTHRERRRAWQDWKQARGIL